MKRQEDEWYMHIATKLYKLNILVDKFSRITVY